MNRGTARVAALLFFSGACALAYQTTWLRQFRLIFGASTFATAAVLAIFMGGLGAGSAILGKRADAQARPLVFYGRLELLIAASATLSQPLLFVVSKIYFALGGSVTLGIFGATIVRLLLATLILGAPTFLMGGTLPAAARAVRSDSARRNVAVLYGTNTLGAVFGTLITTFVLLEALGNRRTLFAAVVVNVVVGITALVSGAAASTPPRSGETPPPHRADRFVLIAAATVGFAFLLMELVWYRMLGPLLGGTTFMFGLILAIALLGIGAGGAAYALRGGESHATIGGFALTCTLEALAILFPFALGDRLAIIANYIRPLGHIGFSGNVVSWCAITFIVVFPAAFIAGIQFPLLIALLGRGEERIGRHVGAAYAFNTAGAIAGSLAAGFGLMPLLGATACWLVASYVLIALGALAIFLAVRARQLDFAAVASLIALVAIAASFSLGPTAVWRHSGIGAGRARAPETRNDLHDWINSFRRDVVWDADGRESSIALMAADDYSFIVNGKSDGSARGDAATQVMGGLVAAAIHPNPRTACVIGLGTGSTAGWLGAVSSMQRVDVVELEPVVLRVAKAMTAVNHNVLANPKVHIRIADAREVLLASRAKYDIIFSEPSNPYRAGVASLFTREYYAAIESRLASGGMFVQWVQTYDVDATTIATIYRTLTSVFPNVETWSGETGDLLLVADRDAPIYDVAAIRARLAQPPFRDALHNTWHTESLEGFFSHYLGGAKSSSAIAERTKSMNTDDRTLIEFGFARTLGDRTKFNNDQIRGVAMKQKSLMPVRLLGAIDWNEVVMQRSTDGDVTSPPPSPLPAYWTHHDFAVAWGASNYAIVRAQWRQGRFPLLNTKEMRALAFSLADDGDELATTAAERIRPWSNGEAEAIIGELRVKQGRFAEAVPHVVNAFHEFRTNAWMDTTTMGRLFDAATAIARSNRALAPPMYEAIDQPFAAGQWEDARLYYRVLIGDAIEVCGPAILRALADMEPYPHWRENILFVRRQCYAMRGLRTLAADAERDWKQWESATPRSLVESSSNRR